MRRVVITGAGVVSSLGDSSLKVTAGFVSRASGIRRLVLLLVLLLISLLAFGGWKLLGAQPEVQTVGSCTAVKQSSVAGAREV